MNEVYVYLHTYIHTYRLWHMYVGILIESERGCFTHASVQYSSCVINTTCVQHVIVCMDLSAWNLASDAAILWNI